jgi:hypothetical protein
LILNRLALSISSPEKAGIVVAGRKRGIGGDGNTGVRETLRREVGPARVENCRDRRKAICKRRMPSAAEVCSFLSQTDFCSITDLLTDTLKQAFENTALI